ncbi:MAG: hypothetical protein ABEH89_00250 [bacterium]
MTDPTITQLKRHTSPRGWVSEIYSGELGENLRNIHLGTMTAGAVRGNHKHTSTREWITFLQSPVLIRWGTPDDFEELEITEPSVVELPVGQPHAFKNNGTSVVSFAAYTNSFYDEENPDVIPVNLFPVKS